MLVTLQVSGPTGQYESVECQVDTGFNGSLQLPLALVTRLRLIEEEPVTVRLADGSRIMVPMYQANVLWDSAERVIDLPATGQQPLIGTKLLDGHRLNAEITPGGTVTIEPL